MTGANIPALKHQSPSKLRRKACLGENSTRMGDLLGSPVLPGWVSCKSEEGIPNGVRGWEVGGTHRGRESLALASG